MKEHFCSYSNIKKLIEDNRPKHIVECGAGSGELTKLIQGLISDFDNVNYSVISDATFDGADPHIKFIQGLSYDVIKDFDDESIDFCIIDTDHNYWTLAKELVAVDPKMTLNGLIVMHDVGKFYHDTGMAMSYGTASEYPEKEIFDTGMSAGGMTDALIDFLATQRFNYKLEYFTLESNGGAVIRKVSKQDLDKEVIVFKPAKNAPFVGAHQ